MSRRRHGRSSALTHSFGRHRWSTHLPASLLRALQVRRRRQRALLRPQSDVPRTRAWRARTRTVWIGWAARRSSTSTHGTLRHALRCRPHRPLPKSPRYHQPWCAVASSLSASPHPLQAPARSPRPRVLTELASERRSRLYRLPHAACSLRRLRPRPLPDLRPRSLPILTLSSRSALPSVACSSTTAVSAGLPQCIPTCG